ncbi:MAG TPA: EAL domain-containing protein, partial [Burkholderiales bacterium]|nr:EAL domain-containing protein [Burkholderiales bacterium]
LEKGRYLHETLPEESANRIHGAILKTFETGKPSIFEFAMTASGNETWFEGSALLFGKKALCLCRNITERKSAESRSVSEMEHLQSILHSIKNGVIATDRNAQITYLNPEAEKLTGWKLERANGYPLSSVFRILDEASREPAENPALAAMSVQPGNRNSFLLIRRDGKELSIDESSAPLVDKNGITAGAVIDFHDVSNGRHLLWHAGHDALTGLLNRVLLHDRLIHSMASVKRQNKLLAVLFIDLDKFKSVNDNMGHSAGDMLLKEVAFRLKNAIRAEDSAARIGGDEFVVLQEATDRHEIRRSLERIMNIMRPAFGMDGKSVDISLSIGVVLYPENDAEPETLLRQADMAMYHAKQSGRDRYHFFDASMDASARATRERRSEIESALKKGELRLHYQPKINLRNGRIVGLEALVRWQPPDREAPLLAADFLPAVQDTQLIVDIGNWVIGSAIGQIREWQSLGMSIDLSVNVASRQLYEPDFLDTLKAAFETYPDVAPSRLELEINETSAIEDFEFTREILSGCREIGLKLALDDFGTGYASLSYLKNLPVGMLKIDRSFLSDMPENTDSVAIIRSIVSMARIFGKEVIAEGLESPHQGRALVRMGCKLAQGFGIAKPMPGEVVPEWIENWNRSADW